METRVCNNCDEEWVDTGDEVCPFCGSENTEILPEEDEEYEEEDEW
jgi:RNA polymerase subunit RPABC4/transcription elongation factor Spt4